MYGGALEAEVSVLHVTALWENPAGGFATLRIGPETPRSVHDRFALGLARARCDAILTTGRILREEPTLLHRFLDDPEEDRVLAEWRREATGRPERPLSVVLTSGRAIDFLHPLFHDGEVAIFTGENAAAALRAKAPAGVEVIGDPEPGPRSALAFLTRRGQRVSIEAGATTSAAFYEDPIAVEELMLSLYRGEKLPDSVRGPRFEAAALLDTAFRCIAEGSVEESSGPWRFARYRRV